MKTLTQKLLLVVLAFVVTIFLAIGGFLYEITYGFPLILKPHTHAFVKQWQSEFSKHSSLEQFQSDLSTQPGVTNQIYLKTFENGEWLIAKDIDSHSSSGIDSTVFRDSRGAIYYQIWHHFCGFCMLEHELNTLQAANLDQLYSKMKDKKIRLKKLR